MLLGLLFLRALCRNKLGSKSVQLAMGLFDLPVQKADAPDERLDVGAGGFGRSGGNLHRWLAQHLQDMGSVEAPDTITFQQLGYGSLADARGLARRGDEFPQIEQPLGAKVFFKLQHGRVIAPKLLAQAVGKPVSLRAKIARDTGPLPQLDNAVSNCEPP